MSDKYRVPDYTTWNSTKIVDEPPKVMCTECIHNSWCVHAPWVEGCDDGKVEDENNKI